MKQFNLFIPLKKVDEANRTVTGIATAEQIDKSNEIMDYESTKPYYKEWSGEIEKASGGKSLGNVREMHTNIAAGKLTAIDFDDATKCIEVTAKIVNDSTWEKVMEGVLTGFSHGGDYVKRWKDDDGVMRYTAKPSEISVVDNPCLGSATFELLRADGSTEMRKFKDAETNDIAQGFLRLSDATFHKSKDAAGDNAVQGFRVEADASFHIKKDLAVERRDKLKKSSPLSVLDELSKAIDDKMPVTPGSPEDPMTLGKRDFSDEQRSKAAESGAALPDGSFPIENDQDLKNAVHAYGRASDKEQAKAHIIARAKTLGHTDSLPEDWAEKKGKKDVTPSFKKEMQKGLYEVARAANLILELEWLVQSLCFEAAQEGDNSPVPNEFRDIMTRLCAGLEALVEEECRELATPHAVELMGDTEMEMAAGWADDLRKKMFGKLSLPLAADMGAMLKLNSLFSNALQKAAKKTGNSAKAKKHLDGAMDAHEDTGTAHEKLGKAHEAMSGCVEKIADCMKAIPSDLTKAEEKQVTDALEKAKGLASHLENMDSHLDKASKQHEKLGKAHAKVSEHHTGIAQALGEPDAEKLETGELQKTALTELQKANQQLTEQNTATEAEKQALQKQLNEVNTRLPELVERVKKLEAQPAPAKGALFDATRVLPVAKGHETQPDPAASDEATITTAGASPEEMRRIMGINTHF